MRNIEETNRIIGGYNGFVSMSQLTEYEKHFSVESIKNSMPFKHECKLQVGEMFIPGFITFQGNWFAVSITGRDIGGSYEHEGYHFVLKDYNGPSRTAELIFVPYDQTLRFKPIYYRTKNEPYIIGVEKEFTCINELKNYIKAKDEDFPELFWEFNSSNDHKSGYFIINGHKIKLDWHYIKNTVTAYYTVTVLGMNEEQLEIYAQIMCAEGNDYLSNPVIQGVDETNMNETLKALQEVFKNKGFKVEYVATSQELHSGPANIWYKYSKI